MSSYRTLFALLAVTSCCVFAIDDDFDFDISDDFEVEFPPENHKMVWGTTDQVAPVNRVFHLAITKATIQDVKHYEAKVDKDKPLPSWLLFDKVDGIFWGVPLENDAGNVDISIKAVGKSNIETDEFKLIVTKESEVPKSIENCPLNEDSTILTLIIDKAVKAIKPKQRVIAINNIAKFFGMPYNAFTLKAQLHPDDITDSSVVLAGPGNLKSRTSKLTSLVEVTVGCEGRLWLKSAPIVHQLKQQARDGTIAEVLRLPLVGWRVKTETRSLLRRKRDDESVTPGSGDYEYYEYEDEYDDPTLESEEPSSSHTPFVASSTSATISSTSTSQNPASTESHPHRHHHGELRPADEVLSKQTSDDDFGKTDQSEGSTTHQSTSTTLSTPKFVPLEETSATPLQTPLTTVQFTSTVRTTTFTSKSTTDFETDETKAELATPISGLHKPSETLDSDDEYEEYEDKDNEESETEVPFVRSEVVPINEVPIQPEIISDTETTIVDILTSKPTTHLVETSSEPATPTTTKSTTELYVPVVLTSEQTHQPSSTESSTTTSTTTDTIFERITIPEDTTSTKHSTLRHTATSTTTPRLTTQEVTEQIEYEVKNFAPTIQIRFNRIPVTAGKNFSQIVPPNMFHDMEDGTNLKLEFLDKEGNALKADFWCQFNPVSREIYGLPLKEDISGWKFLLRATDKEGASVSEKVEIIVQQNKYWRVVNHEFSLSARVEKKHHFNYPLDWTLHVLKGVESTLHSPDAHKITVRTIVYDDDTITFSWTNDSLATNYCPKSDIQQLFGMLTSNDEGVPSTALSNSLLPEIRAKKVTQIKMGVCEELELPTQPPPTPPVPILPPVHVPSNLPPILRNAVDHINATVGELLVYQVPHDTFYDPEDVDPRNLKLHLYTADKKAIPSDHWLQFDSKNKEFFGIPTARDPSRAQYQLICEDTGGLTASDNLVVEVRPSAKLNYNLEFSMTVETEYETFVKSASLKRKFVEKLKKLFNDDNTKSIHLSTTSRDGRHSTIITWYNKSLTKDECPWEEIKKLEALLVNDQRTLSNHVNNVMGDEFVVSAFRIQHLGVCKTMVPITTKIQEPPPPVEDGTGATQESHDEYFITFIVPAVIITTMLLLAAIAACVLYRRRRSGKMNLEEDGRQSYGNKGIPVIFQEELDEKPESGTKAPVILKDEKPPLAPPEYSKSGSLKLGDDSEPYQPPPPFARPQDNGRQARPKPTPTYRKPPPYVPP